MVGRGDSLRSRRGTRVLVLLGCLGLLITGAVLGRTLPHERVSMMNPSTSTSTSTVVVPPAATALPTNATGFARTPAGAAAAAGSYLVALGGDALLDQSRLDATIDEIAARDAREELRATYATVFRNIQGQFGLEGQPRPIVIMRSIPLAYHVDSFEPDHAVVSIWDLGVVGSGATVDPQASWRTQTIALVWEDRSWKASDFRSVSGPVPALAGRDEPSPPAALFTFVPAMAEYTRVAP